MAILRIVISILFVAFVLAACGGDEDNVGIVVPLYDISGEWNIPAGVECVGPLLAIAQEYMEIYGHPDSTFTFSHGDDYDEHVFLSVRTPIYVPGYPHATRIKGFDVYYSGNSGDQIHYEDYHIVEEIRITATGDGTVISEDHIGITYTVETHEGLTIKNPTSGICTADLRRIN